MRTIAVIKPAVITLAALLVAGLARAGTHGSVTVAGLADSEDGSSFDADLHWSPLQAWTVGAGVGHSKSELTGTDFAGNSLRASTDVYFGDFNAGASLQRWKDSNQLRTTSLRGQFGWSSASGLGLSALLDDRHMRVVYATQTLLGQPREYTVDIDGTGFGAQLDWYGEKWNATAHFLRYGYGDNVARARTILNSATTQRFPRLQALVGTVVTRAAGAPDREYGLSLGREFGKSTLQGDWILQRDALSGDDFNSVSLLLGHRFSDHLEIDATAGFSDGAVQGTIAFGGLSLTLRR